MTKTAGKKMAADRGHIPQYRFINDMLQTVYSRISSAKVPAASDSKNV